MLRLRKILLCDFLFYVVLILVSLVTVFRVTIKKTSKYSIDTNVIVGRITDIKYSSDMVQLLISGEEKIVCYFDNIENIKSFSLNDLVLVEGVINEVRSSGVENTFDYKKYLERKQIFWSFQVSNIELISRNRNIFYNIKNSIVKMINGRGTKSYLKAFILGDTSDIDSLVISSFRDNGISHLFAISGMHITMLTTILMKFLTKLKVNEKNRYVMTSMFLFFYLFLTGIRASILRAIIFFLLLSINKYYYFYIKTINIFLLTLCCSLLYDPFYIYDVGFQFSFVISFFLIKYQSILNSSNYFKGLIMTSLVSFMASLPITINNFYQVNILSIIYNLLFVPLVSVVIFPASLVTFFCPFLDGIFSFLIGILENLSLFFNSIDFSKLIIAKLSLVDIIIYYVVVVIFFILFKRRHWWCFGIVSLLLVFFYLRVPVRSKLIMIDVGQGDSLLLVSNGSVALVDTGGIKKYDGTNNSYLLDGKIIPYLKSLGIKKIDYLFLTHGDYDHLGNSYELVQKFKVLHVYFNNGDYNYNEKKLIGILKKKKIPYQRFDEGESIQLGKISLIEMNKYFNEENDNSMILYGVCSNTSFLLMGDASLKSENYLLSAYNLDNVDILKVGHHGSKTSSGKKFIEMIRPKYALISVGLNNKFKHPSASVVETLRSFGSVVLETRYLGSITIDLENGNQIL